MTRKEIKYKEQFAKRCNKRIDQFIKKEYSSSHTAQLTKGQEYGPTFKKI